MKSTKQHIKHYLSVVSKSANTPFVYRAPCGYQSEDASEFTSVSNPSTKGVTCEDCLKKLNGSVLIVKENHDAN
jgi:hypothetical protein